MTRSAHGSSRAIQIGDEFEVEPLRVAHGGHMIAHHGGRTVFVRHALPGERVRVRVTDVNRRIVRADAVDVLRASQDRVEPPCPWSGAAGCGGCDFQHVRIDAQRDLKSEVLATSLRRFAGLDDDDVAVLDTTVRELPGHPDGLGWRTRVTWATDADGVVGLRRHHSHAVVPVDRCLLAQAGCDLPGSVPPSQRREQVRDRSWDLDEDAFWQVHPALPETLVDAVLELGDPVPGDTWWDLYSGAGLFAAFLGERVGESGSVVAVEGSRPAVATGRRALADLPWVQFVDRDVTGWLAAGAHDAPEGVVLDPPRTGAGRDLITALCTAEIPRLVYVACDPVALARDAGTARDLGYRVAALRAYDAFPMTHHFETVALLTRA